MKLYYDAARAPNPRRVRIFLAEKGITVPVETVNLGTLEHKGPAFTAVNPVQRVPALELDNGVVLTESVAICRYFEAVQPDPPLFGQGALETAMVEMWNRRVEFHLFLPIAQVFRHSHPAMKDMEVPQVPAWAEANRPRVTEFLQIFNDALAQRPYVAGERYTIADITALVAVDFMKPARLAVPEDLTNIHRWHQDVAARPSAKL